MMYAFIKGQLTAIFPLKVVLEAAGIGYSISIPANLFGKLPQIGDPLLLHTSYIVRELSHTLYGFLTPQERDLFELLMTVSGIGPKLSLSIIGHLSLHELQKAVGNNHLTAICKVPGIGKKTAERLVVELRDKLMDLSSPDPSDFSIPIPQDPALQKIKDAMSALINLGYNQVTAQKAIKKTLSDSSEEVDLGTLITNSLKNV
jgi:Holliday junction DNA helicase RuvA